MIRNQIEEGTKVLHEAQREPYGDEIPAEMALALQHPELRLRWLEQLPTVAALLLGDDGDTQAAAAEAFDLIADLWEMAGGAA
jgi:hypothetical protein